MLKNPDGPSGSNGNIVAAIGRPYVESRGFQTLATVAASVAVGALLGAGAALLLAPQSGEETRGAIGSRVRRLTGREKKSWRLLHKALSMAGRNRPAKAAEALEDL